MRVAAEDRPRFGMAGVQNRRRCGQDVLVRLRPRTRREQAAKSPRPNFATIAIAKLDAIDRSNSAPVSAPEPKSSSAARPASKPVIVLCISARVAMPSSIRMLFLALSRSTDLSVIPSARVAIAWPASWTAILRSALGVRCGSAARATATMSAALSARLAFLAIRRAKRTACAISAWVRPRSATAAARSPSKSPAW